MKTSGEFVVTLKPLTAYATGRVGTTLNRMSLDKEFSGGLQGTSKGEMLSATTAVQGSAGYVVIEQVEGMVDGLKGSFVLQHFGIMDRGQGRLILEVVPDSGTGQLVGLSGSMSITINGGKHFYEFEYDLA